MATRRPQTTEASVRRSVLAWCRREGHYVLSLPASPHARRGMPDMIVFVQSPCQRHPIPLFVELKTVYGRVTPLQERRHRELRAAGLPVAVVRSILDLNQATFHVWRQANAHMGEFLMGYSPTPDDTRRESSGDGSA